MQLDWRNMWITKDWKPLKATTLEEANKELADMMPYTEDGTQVRDRNTGKVFNWTPPREPEMNFGPF